MDNKKYKIIILVLILIIVSISSFYVDNEIEEKRKQSFGATTNVTNFTNENPYSVLTNQDIEFLNNLQDKCSVTDKIVSYCKLSFGFWSDDAIILYGVNDYGSLELGESMLPLIQVGDTLLEQKYDGGKLNTCEIIRFKAPDIYNHDFAIHRIIGFDGNRIVVKGDNNEIYEVIYKDKVTHRLCGIIKNG